MPTRGHAGFAGVADRSAGREPKGAGGVRRPPDFDELMEGIEEPKERERLRRMHELLLQAGPPPELSPALASVPAPGERRARRRPRRLGLALAFAAALAAAAFAGGYLVGGSDSDEAEMAVRETIMLTNGKGASGVVNLGFKGADGNWPMVVTVRGLAPLRGGDYYVLALARDGKPVVTCGTFNVASGETTVRMTAAYDLERFDGWVITLWDAETRDEKPVLWERV
jgi:hypothetical protein